MPSIRLMNSGGKWLLTEPITSSLVAAGTAPCASSTSFRHAAPRFEVILITQFLRVKNTKPQWEKNSSIAAAVEV